MMQSYRLESIEIAYFQLDFIQRLLAFTKKHSFTIEF